MNQYLNWFKPSESGLYNKNWRQRRRRGLVLSYESCSLAHEGKMAWDFQEQTSQITHHAWLSDQKYQQKNYPLIYGCLFPNVSQWEKVFLGRVTSRTDTEIVVLPFGHYEYFPQSPAHFLGACSLHYLTFVSVHYRWCCPPGRPCWRSQRYGRANDERAIKS